MDYTVRCRRQHSNGEYGRNKSNQNGSSASLPKHKSTSIRLQTICWNMERKFWAMCRLEMWMHENIFSIIFGCSILNASIASVNEWMASSPWNLNNYFHSTQAHAHTHTHASENTTQLMSWIGATAYTLTHSHTWICELNSKTTTATRRIPKEWKRKKEKIVRRSELKNPHSHIHRLRHRQKFTRILADVECIQRDVTSRRGGSVLCFTNIHSYIIHALNIFFYFYVRLANKKSIFLSFSTE